MILTPGRKMKIRMSKMTIPTIAHWIISVEMTTSRKWRTKRENKTVWSLNQN